MSLRTDRLKRFLLAGALLTLSFPNFAEALAPCHADCHLVQGNAIYWVGSKTMFTHRCDTFRAKESKPNECLVEQWNEKNTVVDRFSYSDWNSHRAEKWFRGKTQGKQSSPVSPAFLVLYATQWPNLKSELVANNGKLKLSVVKTKLHCDQGAKQNIHDFACTPISATVYEARQHAMAPVVVVATCSDKKRIEHQVVALCSK